MVSKIYYTSLPMQAMTINILILCTFLSPISALYDRQSIFYFYALRRHVDLRLASQEGLSLARRDSPVFLRIRPRCLKQRQSCRKTSLSHCVSELSLKSLLAEVVVFQTYYFQTLLNSPTWLRPLNQLPSASRC